MSAPQTSFTTVTVSSTSYAVAIDPTFTGYLSLVHRGAAGDPDVLVSFDGTNNHDRLVAGSVESALRSQRGNYGKTWLKLSGAGSVTVAVRLEEG